VIVHARGAVSAGKEDDLEVDQGPFIFGDKRFKIFFSARN